MLPIGPCSPEPAMLPAGEPSQPKGEDMRAMSRAVVLVAILALVAAACTRDEEPTTPAAAPTGGSPPADEAAVGSLLDEVQQRGILRCGVNNTVPGFG